MGVNVYFVKCIYGKNDVKSTLKHFSTMYCIVHE